MTLNASELIELGVQYDHPSGLPAGLNALKLVNRGGRVFCGMTRWNFLKKRAALLDLRGDITLTDATWTESSRTLTKTSAFTNYTWVPGDTVEITDGTSATTGTYEIASRTSANAIVLSASIGSAADGKTDIDGTMTLESVGLPSDFKQVIDTTQKDIVFNSFNWVDLTTLNKLRAVSGGTVTGPWIYSGAVAYAGTASTPILEIYPSPTSNDDEALSLVYRADWTELTDDSDVVNVPDYCEEALIQVVRAVVRGYTDYEDDQAPQGSRVDAVKMGGVWRAAKRDDALVQWDRGPMQGGCVRAAGRTTATSLLRNQVASPG